MDETHARMVGTASGIVHAMVALKVEIDHLTYCPINPRHTRQQRDRNAQVAPLRKIYERLESDLRQLQAETATETPLTGASRIRGGVEQ